jgi:TolB-like protein
MSMMRSGRTRLLLAALLVSAADVAAQRAPSAATEIAVLGFELPPGNDAALVRLADRCVSRLIGALAAQKVAAARPAGASLDGLKKSRAAPFAVRGTLSRSGKQVSAELQLLDVQSGDELRSYMYGPGDEDGVIMMAEKAAPRMAVAVREAAAGR